jgi:hypothetical protein
MKPRALVVLLAYSALLVAACSSAPSDFERGHPARSSGARVLVGTLVDGEGHPLPGFASTINFSWASRNQSQTTGGAKVTTDQDGRFRIDLPVSFAETASDMRSVRLVGAEGALASFDARRAFAPGVHDLGDVLFADPADVGALGRVSTDHLLARLHSFRHWPSDAFDACLRECARRGGQQIVDHLATMERPDDGETDLAVVTARNRAARLADPLVLELVGDLRGPIACTVGELPEVRVAFVNRDPLQRTLRLRCTEAECHDLDLAVDCRAIEPDKDGFQLLRPSHEGLWPGGKSYELGTLEEAVVPIRLSHYLRIDAPGRYELRLAFRANGYWELEDAAKQLPRGVMFLYSKPFVFDVAAAKPAEPIAQRGSRSVQSPSTDQK